MIYPFGIFFRFIFKSFKQFYSFLFVNAISTVSYTHLTLLSNGFIINHIVEPQPPEYMMDIPGMQDEMRRPMMLIVSANKKVDR